MKETAILPASLRHVGWRYLLVHRWQSILMVLGIALGVAVVVSIDMANASAGRAFQLSTEALTGRATHRISGPQDGVDDAVYTSLRRAGVGVPIAPVVTDTVFSQVLGNRPLQLLGVDPFAEAPFRSYFGASSALPIDQLAAFLTRPNAILLSKPVAERYRLKAGSTVAIEVNGHPAEVYVAGLLDPPDSLTQRALESVLLTDISTAQELTGRAGHLSWIDVIIPSGSEAATGAIEAHLPAGYRLATLQSSQDSVEQMTAAFRLNLSALSMLALLVGLFLIYNTMTFSVVQRRGLFGTLRCLGVTRGEVFGMVLSEALAVGVLGSALGIGLGVLMGRQTIDMVMQTINDLYFTTTVRAVGVPVASLVKGGALGILATVLTATIPALEAASVPPRAALVRSGLEDKARVVVTWMAAAGLGLIGLGVVAFRLPGLGLASGFGGTLLVVTGSAMLASFSLMVGMRLSAGPMGRAFGFLGRMAPRNLVNALSRTGIAVAALMVAVSVSIGMTLMIASFRHTVQLWLEATLQGDVYISAPAFTGTVPSVILDPGVVSRIQAWPGIRQVDYQRSTQIDSTAGQVRLAAVSNANIGRERLFMNLWVTPEQVWPALQEGSILITEPLARRLNLLDRGKTLTLFTQGGWKTFPIIGIYYDYATSDGTVLMALDTYRSLWGDHSVTAIDLRLQPEVNPDELSRGLQNALGQIQHLVVRSNQGLRSDVLMVFDRTFAITTALRLLAMIVAFIGVLNTLLLLQLEKQREMGILRALGLTGRQLRRLIMLETGLMGLVAGLLAMPTGYVLALILIYVINQRSFGWTLQPDMPPLAFLQALGIAVAAALLSGVLPAYRLSRMAAADAIRYE